MGTNKQYSGYKSFQYLEPGVDYKPFELVNELGRVETYTVPVTEEQEQRVQDLIARCRIVSLHDHPKVNPKDLKQIHDYIRAGRIHTGYEALSKSGMDAVFDNLQNGTNTFTSNMGWKWNDTIYDIGMRLADIAHQDFVVFGHTASDIERCYQNGQLAFFLSLEAATAIENEVDRIDILYGLGVRMMGLVYLESNQFGAGQEEPNDAGLTLLGRKALRRMNQIGMLIDISHCGSRTALDIIDLSTQPVLLSHGGARSLVAEDMPNYLRAAPDEVIKACGEKGGVIGVEAAPHQTITVNQPIHIIDAVMEHFEYCVDLVGIDHVGFGPDVHYGDHVGIHHAFAEHLSITPSRYPEVEYVQGMENSTEIFPNIIRWMIKTDYSDEDIAKVIGGNAIRVLKEIWGE